jgi:beta-galactosidase
MQTYPTKLIKNYFLFLSTLLLAVSCGGRTEMFQSQRNIDFSESWRFIEDSLIDASVPDFDDSSWEAIDLPHDWSVSDYKIQDSTHIGPFNKDLALGHDVGYLRGGTGWYRKEFVVEKENAGKYKQVIIHFDGVQSEMTLWVNGKEVGQHVYGYTPFYFNITPYLNAHGTKNVLAIKVHKPTQDSRWFTGAGIYRQVSISYIEPVHIKPWGVAVNTIVKDNNVANIILHVEVENSTQTDGRFDLIVNIASSDGSIAVSRDSSINILAGKTNQIDMSIKLDNLVLWDTDNPDLYTAQVMLKYGNEIFDEYVQPFGIRTIDFSAENGFLLNGKSLELKGACMHHDNGLLGAAAFKAAEERRVRIMKENGYNAIRTSHNPPSQFFLDACDKYGMLVIDEAFDMWIKPKRPNDYHRHYEQWWQSDLEAMVKRDRNHPSVIMWSFGNEVQERADSMGVEIGKKSIALIKSLDDTRPITQAVCAFWDNPGKKWDDSAPAFQFLDVGGYNYQWANYEADHTKFPERIMMGTESVPKEAFANWQLVEKHPYIIGDFVWTGMDYIGESGIGYSIYPKPTDQRTFLMPWPTYISWCGDIDITGNKKPQSFYRDVIWGESNLEILVHEPKPDDMKEVTSWWGWPNDLPSWNWEGNEGKEMDVRVVSSYPNVRLELNGKVIGEKAITATDTLTATFHVPYEPGTLRAVAIADGKEIEIKELVTSGPVNAIKIHAELDTLVAAKSEIVFLRISAVDAEGRLVPTANQLITIIVEGEATLQAAGNANPEMDGSFTDNSFHLFRGSGLVILRSTGVAGEIAVSIKTEGDIIETIKITTVQGNR